MADFTALAAQYVGADSEPEMKELAARAAQGMCVFQLDVCIPGFRVYPSISEYRLSE